MSKKVLFCATVDYHFKAFHLPYLKWFKEQGWIVHIAANGAMELPYVDEKFNVPIQRSPFSLTNKKAYNQLRTIINKNKYEIIHCHTPMGGALARLAARKARKQGTKVLYTAHGFHFCKGAPLLNWLIYYPIEKFLSYNTDCLITINYEDYELAVNRRLKARRIEHVHGVGVDMERFQPLDQHKKSELRKSFGYKPDDFLLFYAAEFNKNKNQQLLIEAMALIKDEYPHARLLLAGDGSLQEKCRAKVHQLGVSDHVQFLGFRHDVNLLLPLCDVAVSSSFREGLPVNIMEAMASGLPIIACDNRGSRELIRDNENGWIVDTNDMHGFSSKIKLLMNSPDLKTKLGESGRQTILNTYSIDKVQLEKRAIYTDFIGGDSKRLEGLMWSVQ